VVSQVPVVGQKDSVAHAVVCAVALPRLSFSPGSRPQPGTASGQQPREMCTPGAAAAVTCS
jgi:hypothetical protein